MIVEGSGRNVEARERADYARVLGAGESGEFHCSQCGYGVIVQRTPPRCPMCSGTTWEPAGLGALRRRATGLPK
jgi:rubrerythrin